ncbi:hypothetical protein [Caulobacter sp.]|uniref:hypothetical protein n=1 Tax=Caulobacter sp. TaxID=78 RepID=UPI001B225AE3|nr:hypothetical protein [Caulobacter sp.]MBO9543863.1 hypothetical protein [Caulobacter sp.]
MADEIHDHLRKRRDALQSQWTTFLAVGNGAFLTTIGAKVLDAVFAKEKVKDIQAMADAWFYPIGIFAAGLIFAALIPVFELIATQKHLKAGDPAQAADTYWNKWWNWWPEGLSALCFGGGVILGVVALIGKAHK